MMKTEKWKVIEIRNSSLRKLRLNLRTLIKLAIYNRISCLSRLENIYRDKRICGKHTSSQWRKEVNLHKMIEDIFQSRVHSILRCSMGSACKSSQIKNLPNDDAIIDEDMVWNPITKKWICIHCYNYYLKTQQQKDVLQKILLGKSLQEESIIKMLQGKFI